MTVNGTVYKIKGGIAYVRCCRPESCEHCVNSSLCTKKETELRAYDTLGACEGDTVEVETREDGKSMLVILYIFLVPVAILFLSYFLFTLINFLVFAAIPMLAAYFAGLRLLNSKFDPQVKIIRIISHKDDTIFNEKDN